MSFTPGTDPILICRDQRTEDPISTTRIFSPVGSYLWGQRLFVENGSEGLGGAFREEDRWSQGSQGTYFVS